MNLFNAFLLAFLPLFSQEVPLWMHEQIQSDLAPFSASGLTEKDLSDFMEIQSKEGNPFFLVHYTIDNQQISYFHPPTNHSGILGRIALVNQALDDLALHFKLPHVDFLVTMLDSLDGVHLSVPIFAFANDAKYSSNIVLMPDFEALSGHSSLLEKVRLGNHRFPWEAKINRVIWRGAMTGYPFSDAQVAEPIKPPRMGGVFTPDNFLDFPRTKAITLSHQFPHVIDARYTTLCQCINTDAILLRFSPYFAKSMPVEEQIHYKYQLLIDGNSASYSRAYWQLFSNSVMLKQDSEAIQWYSRALKPWVHYIPVRSDLTDLTNIVDWAQNHDDEAKKISLEAQKFAQNNLTHDQVMYYLYLLLTEYAKCIK